MKAISVKQPWATLIAQGIKTVEVRTWRTKYRGPLLIVSSLSPYYGLKKFKKTDSEGRYKVKDELFHDLKYLHFGRAMCICELYAVEPFTEKHEKGARLTCDPDQFAWCLKDIRPVKPVPIKGQLSLFEVEDERIVVL